MKKQNLLLIVSDEHDPRYTGCGGNPWMHTPNLDALAARGTRFANAYTPSPICVPARAALATGRHAYETGYWDNAIAYDGRWTSWHHRLAGAGLLTESIGKLHFRSRLDPVGFHHQHAPMHIHEGVGLVWGSVRDPLPETRGRSPIFDEIGPGLSKYNLYDTEIAERAKQWLRARANDDAEEPWTLFLGFVAPHMPLVVPQAFLDLYPLHSIEPPKLLPEYGHSRHPWVERMAQHWDHDAALGSPERRTIARACYFALVSFIDSLIGSVIRTLEDCGLLESTMIVYCSDHGDNLGARAMWNKSTLYRESVSIPMILAGPDVPEGHVSRTPVSLIDIYPTTLDVMGVPQVKEETDMPGQSLLQLAKAADQPDRLAFSEYHAVGAETSAFMLANDQFKYHHYVGFEPELFDLHADPEETANLASSTTHAATRAYFERALHSMLNPREVDARAKREQNSLVARFGGRDAALRWGNTGPTPVPTYNNQQESLTGREQSR